MSVRPRRRRCPGRRGSPRGRTAPRAGSPSAITLPKSSTVTRSAMPITRPMSCSTSSTEMPSASRRSAMVTAISAVSRGVQPGRRLVQQQQGRLDGQRAGDVHPLGHAVGQHPDRVVEPVGDAEEVADLRRPGPTCRRSARRVQPQPGGQEPAAGQRVPAEQHVVAAPWSPGTARCSGTTGRCPGAASRCAANRGDQLFAEPDRAHGRPVQAADHVEAAGLAGPVRPDQGVHGARRDGEPDVVQRGDAAEPQRHALDAPSVARRRPGSRDARPRPRSSDPPRQRRGARRCARRVAPPRSSAWACDSACPPR